MTTHFSRAATAAMSVALLISGAGCAHQDRSFRTAASAPHSPVPIPPAEVGLPTVVAEPWIELLGEPVFLEGAAFDSAGNLLFVDMLGHRVLKVGADKSVTTLVQDDALSPLGLAVHQDGRLFVAEVGDAVSGGSIVAFSSDGAARNETVSPSAGFLPDDLVFDATGGFYFTDLKGTSTQPTGGVYYVSSTGKASLILPNLAAANGIALSPDGKTLWVSEYSRNVLHRISLSDSTTVAPLGAAIVYYFTGPAPDGVRVDADGNVYVAIYQQGRVLVFNAQGLPIGQILIPGRDEGRYLLSTSVAMKPGTNVIYLLATDEDGTRGAKVFRAKGFARAAAH